MNFIDPQRRPRSKQSERLLQPTLPLAAIYTASLTVSQYLYLHSGKKEKCDLRIIRHPQARGCNSTDRRDPCRAARNAIDKPWALEYEYAVPSRKQMPTGKDWDAKDEVYYIWGDTDFVGHVCLDPLMGVCPEL